MASGSKCESREHLHDVLWCKIAQALTSSSSAAESMNAPNVTARVACDVSSKNVFHCSSGQCVNASVICNGVTDCPDGSDEQVDGGALCQAGNNTAIIIIAIVITMVTMAAVCWLASTLIDCLSHIYKHCTRCVRRLRRQRSTTSSTSPSSSSSSFDLAASSRILRVRSAFAAAAAATRRGQAAEASPSTPQPHVVVVRGVPPSYSAIVLATAACSPSSQGKGQGHYSHCHQYHQRATAATCCCSCCCCRPADGNTGHHQQRDVNFHVTCPTASGGNVIASSCACAHHSAGALPAALACDGGGQWCIPHQQSAASFTATRCCKQSASSIDSLPPSYSAVYGHYRIMQGTRHHCSTPVSSHCHVAS